MLHLLDTCNGEELIRLPALARGKQQGVLSHLAGERIHGYSTFILALWPPVLNYQTTQDA